MRIASGIPRQMLGMTIAHIVLRPQQPDRPVAEQVRVVDEDLVDDPDVALPHEAPEHGDDVARHDPRHQHQRARDALAAHLAVEQQRDREAARTSVPLTVQNVYWTVLTTAPQNPECSGLSVSSRIER